MTGESPSPALADVLARAKHDSGAIAYHRGHFERAALLYDDAFENYQDELRRERRWRILRQTSPALACATRHGTRTW